MIEAGKIIQDKYCYKTPDRPTMLPPIPNSNFIDKFPEKECSEENEKDKTKQESYAAEVKVYRALESLKEDIVVLHSLEYTNRHFRLFVKDHKFAEDKPNKMFGECDFVAVSKNHIVIIEVSNAQIDNTKTTNKKIKDVFKKKKKQAGRTKELIENMFKGLSEEVSANYTPPIVKWYCALLSVSTDEGAKLFTEEQKMNIIFSDSFNVLDINKEEEEEDHNNFQDWWKRNVSDLKEDHMTTALDLRDILVGLWNIDSQNNVSPEEKCSFGSNIMKIDAQLRNADITYGFRNPERPGFNNPNFVQADDVFKGMGISYLTKEQDEVFRSQEKFLWINGPAGSGKTLLILGKAIQAAKSGENVVIFTNGCGEKAMEIYHKSFNEAGQKFNLVNWKEIVGKKTYDSNFTDTAWAAHIAKNIADKICWRLRKDCRYFVTSFSFSIELERSSDV